MNDPLYHQLRELSWRRKLTDAEEAQLRALLAAHPEAQTEWQADVSLNQVLERLPDVPLASNFTSRVLQAVERAAGDQSQKKGKAWGKLWWPSLGWLPKAAVAAMVLCAVLLGHHHHRVNVRTQIAQSLPKVSSVISLSSPEVWENFSVINQLSHTPPQPDRELLALMK